MIYFDACLIIYLVEKHAGWGGLVERVIAEVAQSRFGLRTPDALHLACAQHHRCEALWTNDDRLASASHGLARNILPP